MRDCTYVSVGYICPTVTQLHSGGLACRDNILHVTHNLDYHIILVKVNKVSSNWSLYINFQHYGDDI